MAQRESREDTAYVEVLDPNRQMSDELFAEEMGGAVAAKEFPFRLDSFQMQRYRVCSRPFCHQRLIR
ncbi:unnamed protein product [Oppiella nova]|uniref:Uncharacterized protein n=1 Tax=Oppiella nova TaxID=334625 RepID=A0A7R9L9E9_9ACAR|nr:unnamed protein product [Oppiella nova]CAG2160330.1 unnamed protein product [Oppiella nova]